MNYKNWHCACYLFQMVPESVRALEGGSMAMHHRIHVIVLVAILLITAESQAIITSISDNFDTRPIGTTDLSSVSPGGMGWNLLEGEVTVSALTAQPTVANSRALTWPKTFSTPKDTTLLVPQTNAWTTVTANFGWSSKYVRKTAGLLVFYQDANNFYFVALGSGTGNSKLIRRINGMDVILGTGAFSPPDVGDTIVTTYRITAQILATGIQFNIDMQADGTNEFFMNDTDPTALVQFKNGGSIGLRFGADCGAYHPVWIDYLNLQGGVPEEKIAVVNDLAVQPASGPGGYRLTFTAPDGDLTVEGMQAATAYDIRYATTTITDMASFLRARQIPNIPDPYVGGTAESIEIYSLPSGPLSFAMIGLRPDSTSPLSNVVSGSASSGSAVWSTPTSRKVGIDLKVAGTQNVAWAFEYLFYDQNIDDHGILYLRRDTEIALGHNANNALPFPLWGGGSAGVYPTTSAHEFSLAGGEGVIRYRLDTDGLWEGSGKQAYVVNGSTYGQNRFYDHPMYKQFTSPFTPKSFYDSQFLVRYSTKADRVGPNPKTTLPEDTYHRGYLDPDSGDEWHEIAYWDDDLGWLQNTDREAQSSDGKTAWIVYNPQTPVPVFSGGNYFTTRPKGYYQKAVCRQTTYLSGNVTLSLYKLNNSADPIQYRIGNGNWINYSNPITISSLGLAANTPTDLSLRIGSTGPVKVRTLIWSPAKPSAPETHPLLLVKQAEKDALWTKIQNTPALLGEYNKLKTSTNQVRALMSRDYEVNERVDHRIVAEQVMGAGLVYLLEGAGSIPNLTWSGKDIAMKGFRSLLATTASYDPIGDECQSGQWSGPCGEVISEWWDRGAPWLYTQMAYDLICTLPDINPIDELKLRESMAREACQKMRFIHYIRGNWNLHSSISLLAAAYTMPSFDSPVFGGATATIYSNNPFTPGIPWKIYVEDEHLPEGLPGGPVMRSTAWDSVWKDGVSKESSSYDSGDRTALSYLVNIYMAYHGINLMDSHPEYARAYEWSIRTRYPWNRNYQSYGQARYTIAQDVHLLISPRFAQYLNLGNFIWHYQNHLPALTINPESREKIPVILCWHDPTIPPVKPTDTGSKSYYNNMIFQNDYTNPNAIQLLLFGRETSWTPAEAHRKDDSTGIFLNAYGERFLTNTDEATDWMRSNSESQNVILVDDEVPGPVNAVMASGPSRATIATMQSSLVTPFLDYGVMATQPNSTNDTSNYKDKAQLYRHVVFPDHRFFVIFDDMRSLDGQSHKYSWVGHCHGALDVSVPQTAVFTKASGRKLNIRFFGPQVTFEQYTLSQKIDWQGTEQPIPYFTANANGVGQQFLTALIPLDLGATNPVYQPLTVTNGTAGKITLPEGVFRVFCQPTAGQEVVVDSILRTDAQFALAKSTGGTLDYIFVVGQTGKLSWAGKAIFNPEQSRSFLYVAREPSVNGPAIITTVDNMRQIFE